MKTVGFRSVVLYLLLLVFVGGLGYFTFNLVLHGGQWAMQPYNGHLYADDTTVEMGKITDRNGNLLAYTENGERIYSENETANTGLNDSVFNRLGRDITLTLDQNACVTAYQGLNGHNGAILVYNYKTGEILCKVSAPTFDPGNVPDDVENRTGVYVDNTLSASFTPGSIFKIVTAAAAMEKWPDSWSERRYDCSGALEMGGDDITCLHGDAHGTQDLYEALGNSCNVYFAQLARDIGREALQQKAEEMGFNRSLPFWNLQAAQSEIDLSACNENQLAWAGVGQ